MSSKMHFDTPFSFEKSIHVIGDLLTILLEPQHELRLAFADRDYAVCSGYSPDYTAWSAAGALDLRAVLQAAAFFKKNASLPLNVNRSEVALQKFLESETQCETTNRRFRNRSLPTQMGGMDAALVFQVQRKIAGILGPFPGIEKLRFGFGPGANVGLSRFTSVRRKLSARPTCTAGAYKYVKYLREYSPHWDALDEIVPVPGGKYASVPKTAKTDRSILVEPLVNSYLQKGIGAYIRQQLLVAGIDLSDQSFNQHLAHLGSVTGEWATIDLASASDTISREVVKELLPCDWWLFLEDIRSQFAVLPDGREIYLQKFSSMGNGFTFELESLIFFAIASTLSKELVQVYGDDIIVKSKDFPAVVLGLQHFGFSINSEKSFHEGLFRESCGRDYFGGIHVRPCYVNGLLSFKELFRLHNYFVREHDESLAACVLKHIPISLRIYGPDGFGDGHLLGDHPRTRSSVHRKRGFAGYTFRTYQTQPKRLLEPLRGDLAAFYYLAAQQATKWWDPGSSVPSLSMYQERGSSRYVIRRVYTLGEG